MRRPSTRRTWFSLINLFTLVVVVFGASIFGFALLKEPPQKPFPVRITYHQVYTAPDGARSLHAVIKRAQVGRDWNEVQTYFDAKGQIAKVTRLYAVDERGLVKVDNEKKQLKYLGPHHPEHKHLFSEEIYKADPSFIGEGNILGYRTLIVHYKQDNGGYFEEHAAPELGGAVLRHIFHSGGNYFTTVEAVKIEPGAPSVAEMRSEIPDYPVIRKDK